MLVIAVRLIAIEADEGDVDIDYSRQFLDPLPNFSIALSRCRINHDRYLALGDFSHLDRRVITQLIDRVRIRTACGVQNNDQATNRHCDCFQFRVRYRTGTGVAS